LRRGVREGAAAAVETLTAITLEARVLRTERRIATTTAEERRKKENRKKGSDEKQRK
jgi:hypothetical protein